MLSESTSYNGINGSFETIIANYTFSSLTNSPIYINLADDFFAPTSTVSSDQYRVLTRTGIESTTQEMPELVGINTMNLQFIQLGKIGESVHPLDSALMPTDHEIINNFGDGSLTIGLNFAEPLDGNTRLILSIAVPGVQLASIPEPSTTLLLLAGAAVLLAMHRKKVAANLPFKLRPNGVPLFAFTDDITLARQLRLVWGVEPMVMKFSVDPEQNVQEAIRQLRVNGWVHRNDNLVIATNVIVGDRIVDSLQLRHVQ